MALTNGGKMFIAAAITGQASQVFNNANSFIGVGDGTAAFDGADTDLVGANKTRVAMEMDYPMLENNVITFRSIFGPLDGNHDWKEWGVFNDSVGGMMLNRKVEDNGTKASGTWAITVSLEIS